MAKAFSVGTLREHLGRELAASGWRTLTQASIDAFADATGDHQWIHVDPERARASAFGSTIVHGFLTLSLLPAWAAEAVAIEGATAAVNYGLNRVRFVSAVPAGSHLRARFTPAAIEEVRDGAQVTWTVLVERQGGEKPACVVEWLVRYLF